MKSREEMPTAGGSVKKNLWLEGEPLVAEANLTIKRSNSDDMTSSQHMEAWRRTGFAIIGPQFGTTANPVGKNRKKAFRVGFPDRLWIRRFQVRNLEGQ